MEAVEYHSNHKKHPREQFTEKEDELLKELVSKYGADNWKRIASKMENRNSRQCKERWNCYLSPDINKSPWTDEEDRLLIKLYREIGSKWKIISSAFKNRTHISVRNRMKTLLKQKTAHS